MPSYQEEVFSDNILLAQELLAGYNQMRLPERCTLKLDIQKAYDSVEWDFLLAVLKLFNFPDQFIAIIEQCISTASFSVSLNGSIHGFFKGGRGLRQGDPMSPYLFVFGDGNLELASQTQNSQCNPFPVPLEMQRTWSSESMLCR
ncbi:UNVERIFIED_CONTAM: hypothetical protein Sangu_3237400 [Sesamum angustifolium]|uniref:Reverse transcriptase domain-containing protein n=1 Tax=Sesamum angustifolium TaxID=2727405 RepID=A0AAW2JHM4_9LAMI